MLEHQFDPDMLKKWGVQLGETDGIPMMTNMQFGGASQALCGLLLAKVES